MTDFATKLRLKEMAEEDIYFARRDRELIKAMHERKLAAHLQLDKEKEKKRAAQLERKLATADAKHHREPWKLGERYRSLIRKAWKLFDRKR